MSFNALYTDLSGYYDLMCVDIDYPAQSNAIHRLQQIFGNGETAHLDLACGTGPHVRHFIDFGYASSGLDINQPMLDIAATRCPEAQFTLQDMGSFEVSAPLDLITCFLYSIHYNAGIEKLKCAWPVCTAHSSLAVFSVLTLSIKRKLITVYSLNIVPNREVNYSRSAPDGTIAGRVKSSLSGLVLKRRTLMERRCGTMNTLWWRSALQS